MTDFGLTILSAVIFAVGIMFCIFLGRIGLSRDWSRDALHIGVVLWTLLVGRFSDPAWPDAIVSAALVMVLIVPVLARRYGVVNRVMSTVAGGSETWTGIVVYVLSYTVLTWLYPVYPAPALAAMAALSMGDGLGGMVGRVFGRLHYRLPWTKTRSIEGSITVALGAIAGMAILNGLSQLHGITWESMVMAGILAAVAEAVAPKSLDNLFVPLAVFLVLI